MNFYYKQLSRKETRTRNAGHSTLKSQALRAITARPTVETDMLKSPLKTMLILQSVWACLGFGYNLGSLITQAESDYTLAPTDPVVGAVFILMSLCIIGVGVTRFRKLYACLATLLTVLLAYSGVYLHITAYIADPSLSGYASPLAWATAILINLFGTTVLFLGAALAIRC